jgi:hypothetical protein
MVFPPSGNLFDAVEQDLEQAVCQDGREAPAGSKARILQEKNFSAAALGRSDGAGMISF